MATGKTDRGSSESRIHRSGIYDARLIELVDSRRQDSLRYNAGTFGKLHNYYNAYRGVWQGKHAQFRNNISLPFIFAMIQSDVARKVQTSFGTWPIVSFEGYAPEDVARARRNEVLISAQMKDADSVMRATDFFLQADICGTGVARWGWKNITRKNRYRKLENIAPGLSIPVLYEDPKAEIFNGPIWETVDRLDFWQQPARKRIDDMDWVIHRYWLDWDNMMDDASGPYPYFDPEAVRALKDFPLSGSAYGELNVRRVTFRNEYDYEARQRERFSKPVEIWEMHGLVPSEFAPDGMRHRCVAIANERVVLKNREGPMPNQQKPFASYSPMSDPYSFDGVGKAEIAYGPARTADRLNNQRLDAIDLLIDPQWVVSSTANINTQNLFSRAGRVIMVDGDAGDSSIRPLTPDMRGVNVGGEEIGHLFRMMQLGTGETESLLGTGGQSRETARGFLGRQENALTRLSLETRMADEGFIEPLANAFRSMDRLWLSLPHQLKILGSLATVNPTTGLPYEPESTQIDYDDLAPDYRARAVGASQMIGRSVRQQNFMGLLQMMSTNPALMQLVNWANFARQAFELFDFKNVNELLVQQVPMVNQIAQETGQSPQSVAGTASTSLDQLSPEILSQLMNVQGGQPLGNMA
jgi:hypothetical protein